MPSSKCGGLIPSRKNRRNAPSPTMIHGVQSVAAARRLRFSHASEGAGETSGAASATLLLSAAMRILVTGGCGFIGSNFIRYILQHYKPASVSNVDVLTYAGNLANLDGIAEEHGERYEFFKADIANADQMDALMTEHSFYAVINFAAESHVDRSINDPLNFIHTNVVGTSILLDCARRHGVQRFIQISTDEVYGSLGETGKFTALFEGKPDAVYNFGGDSEMTNIETVKAILKKLGKPETLISYVTDRLGHDRRYAIDSSFAQRELKWKPLHNFKDSLDSTIDWYQNNRAWWEPLLERTGRH